jgi:hypothetical protein
LHQSLSLSFIPAQELYNSTKACLENGQVIFGHYLSVTTAPVHARQIYRGIFHPTNGRPADLRNFGVFIARLIERYPHQIHAIEMMLAKL